MRKLDTSSITGSVGFPMKAGTLNHLQLAYQEVISAIGKCLSGSGYDPSKVYILNGCVNSGSGNTFNISAGAIFYNGEVYLVDATTFTVSGPSVTAVGIIPNPPTVTTGLSFYSDTIADPVQFTDGVTRNVHQIRKCVVQAGLSGSGAADYLNWVDVNRRIQGSVGQVVMWVPPGPLATYFNNSGAGIHPYTIGWQIVNGQAGAINMKGRMPVAYDPGDPDFANPYNNASGEKQHTLTTDELPVLQFDYDKLTIKPGPEGVDGTQYHFQTESAKTNSIGNNQPHNNMPPYLSVLFVQRMF